jgi:hypothetical protein
MSDQEIEELKALVISDRKSKSGPFSHEVRERVQGFLKEKRQSGERLKHIGQQLGLRHHTVQYGRSRWIERDEKTPNLRRVAVASEKATESKTLTMYGPAGARIDGLNLEEAAAHWRKLS